MISGHSLTNRLFNRHGAVRAYYLVAVLVCLSITLGFQQHMIRTSLAQHERENMASLAKSLSSSISEMITSKMHQFDLIGQQFMFLGMDNAAIISELKSLHGLQCQYTELLFFADPSGEAINSLSKEIEMGERPYFRAALQGIQSFSDTRVSATTNTRVISLAVPVVRNGKVVGVFGGNIGLDAFLASTQATTFGRSGYAYIIDSDGTILSSPNPEQIYNVKISDSGSESLDRISPSIIAEKTGFGRYVYQDVDKFVSWAKVEKTGWTVVVTSPVNEFFAHSNSILRSVLMVISFLFGIVILLGLVIVKRNHITSEQEYRYNHDQLTGLYSRAFCEEAIDRLNRTDELPISLIMGDVNNLKLVNDTFGHEAGDKLLVQIAEILVQSCRKEDIIARWGGDEFVILSPLTDEQTAQGICNRIEHSCKNRDDVLVRPSIALGSATKEEGSGDLRVVLKKAEERMYHHKAALHKGSRTDLDVIRPLLKTKRPEEWRSFGELKRLTLELGKAIGLSERELTELSLLVLFHDIGQVTVPRSILQKDSELSPEERELIEKHPEIGYRITKLSSETQAIAQAILAHHERWDGTGYPQKLKEDQIPLLSRVLAITVAYDAMCSGRPYRGPMSKAEALRELWLKSGTQFDPELVRAFLALFPAIDDAS